MTRLFWDRAGSGEPLVLLHGIGTTHADFTALRPLLDGKFAVFAPDLPGQGASEALVEPPTVPALADAIEADLDALGLERVHLLGDSLGARLALELASRGRALSVVAISPSGLGLPAERAFQGAVLGTSRSVLRPLRHLISPVSRVRLGRAVLLTGLRSMPWLAGRTETVALEDGIAGSNDFWRLLWFAVLGDVPVDLRITGTPVLLAQGTADVLAGGQAPRFLSLVPAATFTPLFGGGHAPQSDRPAEIIALVDRAVNAAHAADRAAPVLPA